jgi:hypothetical protein
MRTALVVLLVIAVVGIALVPAASQSFVRSIGLRFTLPWGGQPLLVGVEATGNLGIALASAAFFLSARGEGMLLVGAGIPLGAEEADAKGYFHLVTGFYYFDLSAFAPSPLGGGGLLLESEALSPFLVGLAVDIIYPIALPVPLFSATLAWALP